MTMIKKNTEFTSMSSFNDYLQTIPKIDLLTYGESTFKIDKEINHIKEEINELTKLGISFEEIIERIQK